MQVKHTVNLQIQKYLNIDKRKILGKPFSLNTTAAKYVDFFNVSPKKHVFSPTIGFVWLLLFEGPFKSGPLPQNGC